MGLPEDLSAALDLFEELEAPHMVVGGLALEALGVPRSTLDIDLQVHLDDPPDPFSQYFHGWFVDEHARDTIFDQDTLILEGKATGTPVEVFLTGHWFTEQALDRRQTVHSGLLDRSIPVPTPEDFILLKAAYSQGEGRSEAKVTQDRLDIESVLDDRGGDLPLAYLEENARKLEVWDVVEPLIGGEGP